MSQLAVTGAEASAQNVITTTFKQGPVETKDLQAFAISQKSVECEK
jgi:hypothetical protein